MEMVSLLLESLRLFRQRVLSHMEARIVCLHCSFSFRRLADGRMERLSNGDFCDGSYSWLFCYMASFARSMVASPIRDGRREESRFLRKCYGGNCAGFYLCGRLSVREDGLES